VLQLTFALEDPPGLGSVGDEPPPQAGKSAAVTTAPSASEHVRAVRVEASRPWSDARLIAPECRPPRARAQCLQII
jgi:hypothetical protein